MSDPRKKLAKLKKEGKLDKAIKDIDSLETGADVLIVAKDVLDLFAGVFGDDDTSDEVDESDSDSDDTDDSNDDFGGGDFGGGGASDDW